MDMIGSFGSYDVVSFYRRFVAILLGFDDLRILVELEGFSPDGLIVRICTGRTDDQAPKPTTIAARGRVGVEDDHTVVLLPIAPATSQVGGGAQTPAARTPEHRVQVDQALEYIPMPLVAPVQHETRVVASEADQLRLESELTRHAPALFATVKERVRRFIEGLHPSIRTSMARELEMDISYQRTVSIARRVEGARAPAARYGRGFVSRPVYSALPAASGVPAPPRPQEPYYAPPVASMPPARGAITGQTSRPGPSQSQPPRPPRDYFEYGDTRHMVPDCPKARKGAPPQTYQPPRAPSGPPVILPALVAAPPPQAARGTGRGGRGHPRG
ncbi:PREDICTED: uncharacterized protein LOC109239467 [Nicotiana attenuata]|uniref:uncharacterized protein LOC109239467 n=1 Tax=Nicotiana attenuata TaxID=49451 RepID=UPI000904BB33|nr:PREDICTED: uncharacterized protein LOC109239467 [Nicotiana attenuata]